MQQTLQFALTLYRPATNVGIYEQGRSKCTLFQAPCLFVCVCVCVCVCVLRLSDNRLFLSNLSRPEAPRAHASIQCIQFILKRCLIQFKIRDGESECFCVSLTTRLVLRNKKRLLAL